MKYKFEYTVESKVCGTVIIDAEDEYDACSKFDMMREDLIIENADELRHSNNFRVADDPYFEKI